jgi:hypothetical protein
MLIDMLLGKAVPRSSLLSAVPAHCCLLCIQYQDSHRFLGHIDQFRVVQPDSSILIGAFSSVRDQQARIEGALLDLLKHESPSQRPAKKKKSLTSEDSTRPPKVPSVIP